MVCFEMGDDHYIANARNAHIDTSEFENEILAEIKNNAGIKDEELVELIYRKAFSRIAVDPVDPGGDVLICRYLTPEKFIKFLDTRKIAFPVATQFADRWECKVPEDYDKAVLRIFGKLNRSGVIWERYVRSKSSAWNISCWTELNHYFDDHLMWENYAGGADGIGITIRYSQLKTHLINIVKTLDLGGQIRCGRVNYEAISLLPFNKHQMYRNEKEIRFAFQSHNSELSLISIDEIFDLFGVRISPAAEPRYSEMIRKMWLNYGGKDRVQHPV